MTRWQLTKKEVILQILRENPDTWMSAGEIAQQCRGGKWCSAKDIGNMLRGDYTNVERKNVSTNSNPSLRYRYAGSVAE